MPSLHESVTQCDRCDLIVAAMDVTCCEECTRRICPECPDYRSIHDKDLRFCSGRCAAIFDKKVKVEAYA